MRKKRFAKANEKLTDVELELLNGPVKQVMHTSYHAFNKGEVVEQGKMESDSSGSETNYIITFNRQGRRIQEVGYGTNDYRITLYNEHGLQTESEWHFKGKLHSKTTYTYNSDNRPIEVTATDADGKISHRTIYTYNDIGQQTEHCTYHGNDLKLRSKTVYTYHPPITEINGIKYRQITSCIEYNGDGAIVRSTINTYNEQNKQIESISENADEKMSKYNRRSTYKYNDKGDCIEQNFYNADGSLQSSHTYTHEYDSEGKKIVPPVKGKPYDPYELKPGESEKTENDHHGNWIKKITFFEKRPVNIFLRQFSYYGEPSENQEPFIHPITQVKPEELKRADRETEDMEPDQAKWLAEGTNTPDVFPAHRYYAMKFREMPSVVNYNSACIEAFAVLSQLTEKLGARIIHSTGNVSNGWTERLTRFTLSFQHYSGYLFHTTNISRMSEEEYIIPSYIDKLTRDDGYLHFGSFILLRPSEASGKRNDYFEETLSDIIDDCTVRRIPEKPFINIVETTSNGFVMKEHPVDDSFEISDLDVNYGYGFQQFHSDLMQRFNKSTKGLVLFHGEPGTGKTYYIRHLLRKMVANRKVVIYMPPNMVDHLTDPVFMTFLIREVREFSAEGNFCVLLIEDAEPLLAKRVEGVRIQGVTNLLNLSDGLLNDMLNLQIICTFNVDLKKLDSALLRPGRLLARKEFKKLSELDANLLAQRLGIKHHFKKPATLSEVYALRKNQNTLIHDVEPDRDASTVLDDL